MAPTDETNPNHQTTMHPHHNQSYTNGATRIIANCRMCDKPTIITVNTTDYRLWRSGVAIQDALPELSAGDRELLISGFCGDCFDRLVADEQ